MSGSGLRFTLLTDQQGASRPGSSAPWPAPLARCTRCEHRRTLGASVALQPAGVVMVPPVAAPVLRAVVSRDTGPGRPAADQADQLPALPGILNQLAVAISQVGPLLAAAGALPVNAARVHVTEALSRLDDAVEAARDHVSAEQSREVQSALVGSPLMRPGRLRWAEGRAALLRERLIVTVRALQASAAETATLLEQQAGLVKKPARADYPTEIKRWQTFADQAEQMATRLEQHRGPDRELCGAGLVPRRVLGLMLAGPCEGTAPVTGLPPR
jgi:hypothetical protein